MRLRLVLGLLAVAWSVALPASSAAGNILTDVSAVLTSATATTLPFPGAQGCVSVHLSRQSTGEPLQATEVTYIVDQITAFPDGPESLNPPYATVELHGTTDSTGNGRECLTPSAFGVWRWSVVFVGAANGDAAFVLSSTTVDQKFVPPPAPQANIVTTIETDATTVALGDTFPVTYTVTDTGQLGAAAFHWYATDFNGASDYVSATPSRGSCSGVLVCDFGPWQPGDVVTVATVMHARAVGTIDLQAGAEGVLQGNTSGPYPAYTVDKRTITVVPRTADLEVTLSASPRTVRPKGKETAVITVTNAGPYAVPDGVVTVAARGLQLRSLGAPCTSTGACSLPPLPVGGSLRMVAHLVATRAGRAKLTARVASVAAADPIPGNNTAVAAPLVRRR